MCRLALARPRRLGSLSRRLGSLRSRSEEETIWNEYR
jgi:hypothetical protein